MEQDNFYMYLLLGSIGVLLQILLKIKDLKTKYDVANINFVFAKYLRDDWPAIAGSFATVILAVLILPEIQAVKPEAMKFARIGFAFIGFTGSSVVQMFFSATSKKILAVIDLKTNIADGVVPPVTPENVEAIPEVEKGDTSKKKN